MNKWKAWLGTVVMVASLAGCGTEQTATQENGALNGVQSNSGVESTNGAAPQIMNQADLLGKVKSIDGQTMTLYQSAMNQMRAQGTGGRQMSEGGQMPEGGEPPAGSERPNAPTGDGERPEGGRMNMEDMFTEETVQVTVTDSTKIISMTFENEQRVEKELTLADLKADDIVSVVLKEDTQEAETVTLGMGGFGGPGGGGGRQSQQQQ